MDIFLIKTIKKLIALWGGFSIALTLIIFLQTFFGKYESHSLSAWGWLAINLLPVNVLILLGFFLN